MTIKHGYSVRDCYCKLMSRAHRHGCSTQLYCTKPPKGFRIIFHVVDKTARLQSLNFTKLNDFRHFVAILNVRGPSRCTSTVLSKVTAMVTLTAAMAWIYRRKIGNEIMKGFCENCVYGQDGKICCDLYWQNLCLWSRWWQLCWYVLVNMFVARIVIFVAICAGARLSVLELRRVLAICSGEIYFNI